MGDTLKTSIRNENTLAFSSGGKKSLTIAVAAMDAEQAPIACIKRRAISISIEGANVQPIEVMQYKNMPAYKGILRPYRSSNGPYNSWPIPIPIKKDDKERATLVTGIFIAFAISGKPGKYMSMEKGTIVVSGPNNKIMRLFLFRIISVAIEKTANVIKWIFKIKMDRFVHAGRHIDWILSPSCSTFNLASDCNHCYAAFEYRMHTRGSYIYQPPLLM